MYDTIHFWLPGVEAGCNIIASTGNLTNVRETVNHDTGEVWTRGNIDNLNVTVSLGGISIKGSLAKFFLPDNTYTLCRNQVREAIGMLSDTLHLPLLKASITRVDLSANFMMEHETDRYYSVLGFCPYFDRVQATKNTLYYHSRGKDLRKTMAFYNKEREVSAKSGVMPEVYSGTNLLRYESRWNTRLPHQLKEPEVKGCTLSDSRFYGKIIGLWADNYFKIDKKRKIKNGAMNNIKTVSDATDFICALALQKLQDDEVQTILNDMKNNGVFEDRKYYTRLKAKIKEISSKANMTETDDLVKELDAEVRQVLAYKR